MSSDQDIDHAISAASLVLAVLAALYTLWLAEIRGALDLIVATDRDNRGPQRARVLAALRTKAWPLLAASVVACAIMVPRGLGILSEVCLHARDWAFDDVKAFFVFTALLIGVLAIVAGAQVWALKAKLRALER